MNSQFLQKLFSPYKLGPFVLDDRVVMPPLTRLRADPAAIAEPWFAMAASGA